MKNKNIDVFIVLIIIVMIALGFSVFKKPTITAKVILGKEAIYSENLNLQVNESGTYEWNIKNPGSIKSLRLSGAVSSNGTAKVYIEKNGTRQLLFDSTKQLFDVNVYVLPEYKKIFLGDEMLIQITLLNVRGFGSGNVSIKYSIKDPKGSLIASEQETAFVETQAKLVRKLIIPAELKPGTYTAFVEAFTDVVVGTGSDTFEVKSKLEYVYPPELKFYLAILAVAVAFVIALLLGIYAFKTLKKKKEIAKIKEKMPLEKVEKLEKELKALEDAYKLGFISEESYRKDKERIEKELQKLRK